MRASDLIVLVIYLFIRAFPLKQNPLNKILLALCMHANLYKCQILNKVKLLQIHMQQDMKKKLYKMVIPREIHGDLIVNC